MAASHPHGHNGGGLSPDEQRKLWDHVRAMEVLNEQMEEIRADIAARKQLAKADGFDTNIVAAILKRRKAGEGETRAADNLVRMYEDGLRDQGALPLEQTKGAAPPPRKPLEEIAQELHGQPLPHMPERPDLVEYEHAKEVVIREDKASAALLERTLEITYAQACRHIERMENDGIVSKPDAVGQREVLVLVSGEPKQESGTKPTTGQGGGMFADDDDPF